MLTCLRGPPEPPDVEVVDVSVRFDTEKEGHFYLALRLRDAPRRPMEISAIRYRMKVDGRWFTAGWTTLPIRLEPGVRDLPLLSLPFALEDPVSWRTIAIVGAVGQIETGPGTDLWIGFDQEVVARVTLPPRDW